jgi:hypothetical protein
MRRLITFALALLAIPSAFAQTCVHKDLSLTLTFITQIKRYKSPGNPLDSCRIMVKIVEKASHKAIQEISFGTQELYDGDFAKCRLVRSYVTGKNRKAIVIDDDYGDIVVADLNFDSREDLAIKSQNGNAGAYYTFYIQGPDKQFRIDHFLTDSVGIFPTSFNKAKRSLTVLIGGMWTTNNVYQLDKKGNWRLVRHRFYRTQVN